MLKLKNLMKAEAEKYTYRTEWSQQDGAFIARVLEFPSLAAHGKHTVDALRELVEVVAAVLADMRESGEKIPQPLGMESCSGKVALRISPDLHRRLKIEAAEREQSLNTYLAIKLSQ